MRFTLFAFVLFSLLACQNSSENAATTPSTANAPASSLHNAAFNQEFKDLLGAYYGLKEAFVAEQDTAIQSQSLALQTRVDSLQFPGLSPADTSAQQAMVFKASLQAELKALLGETDREEKRKAFEMVSEQIYALAQAVRYDQEIVYRQFCPMAFNDKGAVWLSNASDIRNPYLPKTMLHCGEVKDSLDARKMAQ